MALKRIESLQSHLMIEEETLKKRWKQKEMINVTDKELKHHEWKDWEKHLITDLSSGAL